MFSGSGIFAAASAASDKAMDSCFSSASLLSTLSVALDKVVLDEALTSFGLDVDFFRFVLLEVSVP